MTSFGGGLEDSGGAMVAHAPIARQGGGGHGGQRAGPGRSAANSHAQNAQYMEDFEAALVDMGMPSHELARPARRRGGSGAVSELAGQRTCCLGGGLADGLLADPSGLIDAPDLTGPPRSGGWREGPVDPAGTLIDFSDRNLLCMSLASSAGRTNTTEVVVGSADHALYTFDLETATRRRTLYTKQHGHRDWVSCCVHTSGGQVHICNTSLKFYQSNEAESHVTRSRPLRCPPDRLGRGRWHDLPLVYLGRRMRGALDAALVARELLDC